MTDCFTLAHLHLYSVGLRCFSSLPPPSYQTIKVTGWLPSPPLLSYFICSIRITSYFPIKLGVTNQIIKVTGWIAFVLLGLPFFQFFRVRLYCFQSNQNIKVTILFPLDQTNQTNSCCYDSHRLESGQILLYQRMVR